MDRVFHDIKDMIIHTFSDSEYARIHAKRTAAVQIAVATIAFVLLMRVFPMGVVRNHTWSRQQAYDRKTMSAAVGDVFTAADKKLQMLFFSETHIYQITLYMECAVSPDQTASEAVLFRLYNDAFSCVYEEEIDNKKIAKKGFLTATPDLDVEQGKAYYYEILIDAESSASYRLPTAERSALGQTENSTLYIDGIINDDVSLIADFDYSRPLTAAGIIGHYVLILVAALVVYLLLMVVIVLYDAYFSHDSERIARCVRAGSAAVWVLVSAGVFVYAVVLNRFGGEVWDRLFFTAGIVAADMWVLGFLRRAAGVIRPKERAGMPAGRIICLAWRNYIQTVSFGLLFYALCQYVNADRNFYHYTNTRWMLIFLAAALLMNYSEKQFVNRFSAIWLALGAAGSFVYCRRNGVDEQELLLARLTCGVVVSWGVLLVNILLNLVRTSAAHPQRLQDRVVRLVHANWRQLLYGILWVVFSLLMYANRYEKVWVFTATLPFAAFLFTADRLVVKLRFLNNFSNGVLLSFALVTVFCLAHRPHHYWQLNRYGGIFHTVACTGMYLAAVYGVALAKLYGRLKNRKNIIVYCYPEYFVTACVSGFILLTMSRTAFLTVCVTTVMVVLLTVVVYHKGVKRILTELGVLAAACLISFPMVFTAVRMIPALVNDPVRYDIEFQDRSFMIYEGDPIDSDKYMTVRRFFATLFGRFQTSPEGGRRAAADETGAIEWWEAGDLVYAGNSLAALDRRGFSMMSSEKDESGEPQEGDISNGRFEIFQDYIREIGFRGHPNMGPVDKSGSEHAHAHNSYLQVAYNFGLTAGILFLILCVMTLWRSVRFVLNYGRKYRIALVPFALVVVFGFISLTEWAYHPCIPIGFSFLLMQVVLMNPDTQERQQKSGAREADKKL